MPKTVQAWKCSIPNCSFMKSNREVVERHEKRDHNIKCVVCGEIAETPMWHGEPYVYGEPWCDDCTNKQRVEHNAARN